MCQRFVEKENTFRAGFPYEYTPDQSAAIEDILSDMNSTAPMDRLLS